MRLLLDEVLRSHTHNSASNRLCTFNTKFEISRGVKEVQILFNFDSSWVYDTRLSKIDELTNGLRTSYQRRIPSSQLWKRSMFSELMGSISPSCSSPFKFSLMNWTNTTFSSSAKVWKDPTLPSSLLISTLISNFSLPLLGCQLLNIMGLFAGHQLAIEF